MKPAARPSVRFVVLYGSANKHPFERLIERHPGPVLLALLLAAGLLATFLGN